MAQVPVEFDLSSSTDARPEPIIDVAEQPYQVGTFVEYRAEDDPPGAHVRLCFQAGPTPGPPGQCETLLGTSDVPRPIELVEPAALTDEGFWELQLLSGTAVLATDVVPVERDRPAAPQPGTVDDATDAVRELLDLVAAGRFDQATELWNGYPYRAEEAEERLSAMVDDRPWLIEEWSATYVNPLDVSRRDGFAVTVVSSEGADAATFVVGVEVVGDAVVTRIPETLPAATPQPGSVVAPGDRLTMNDTPIEGGARAFLGLVEVPAEVIPPASTTSVRLPEDLPSGPVVLTLVLATPEVPAASAYVYLVE